MRFRVLGPVEIATVEGNPATPKALKLRSLLAYLCMHRGEAVSSSRLIEALWSGAPPRTASTALHVYVSKLRKHLESIGLDASSVITTQPPGYRLNLGDHSLDVSELDTLLATAAELRQHGCPEKASQIFGRAVSLWRGRAFEDLRDLSVFESIGRQLDERLTFAQEQRFEIELELGNHKEIIGELYSLVDDRPTWENLHGYLMLALYRGGRTAEALSTFGRIRRNLVTELGIEPAPRLQRLHHAVLTHDPSLGACGADVLVGSDGW
ncbi:AfsR/SARP family transcriptional regulator [Streptomyces sp. NPDC006984]|uniref:AfsR/SARP family transcriptional regulator n=1 Tax=Streptomyces sp. NPDC006984 TaxID=3155463 RepID=UPI0033F27394